MDCYNKFANFYNRLIDCDYDKWSQFLIEKGCVGNGIDLACGTGNITFRLAESGCQMVGIDLSPQMLMVAEGKKKNVKNPMFRCQDITTFSVTKQVDFVTCICDGINYVKGQKDVAKVFANVYAALKDGGKFVFDVSSEYKLKKVLGNNFFYEDDDDLTYFWTNQLKKDSVIMELAFFVKDGNCYQRFDERHVQYIYGEQTLVDLLTQAGFKDIKTFADYQNKQVAKDTQRVVFCATK